MKTKIRLIILALVAAFAIGSVQQAVCQANILMFNISADYQTYCGLINTGDATVTIWVPFGTDITNVAVDQITLENGASIAPDPISPRDYTNPVVYTVTAGTITKNWTVTINIIPPSNQKELLSFSIPGSISIVIDHNAKSILAEVDPLTDLTTLMPEWTISQGASMYDNNPADAVKPGIEIFSGLISLDDMQSFSSFWPTTAHFFITADNYDPNNPTYNEYTLSFVDNTGSTLRIGDVPDPGNFGEIFTVLPVEKTLIFRNDGARSVSLESIEIMETAGFKSGGSSPFVITQQPAAYPVEINGIYGGNGDDEVELKIQFNPACPGTFLATLKIGYNGTFTTVDLQANVIIPPVTVTLTGNDHVYSGYTPQYQTTTLTADPAGGTYPYVYLWSTGQTSSSITVIPASTTAYSCVVTDSKGCTASDEMNVEVEDVRVIMPNGKYKIRICHNPESNPKEMELALNAVAARLAQGDHLGECVLLRQGDTCDDPITLTLPAINLSGTTSDCADDYHFSPCSPWSNYMDGNDEVYLITLSQDGYLHGDITGAYGSIHVLDRCPEDMSNPPVCFAFASGPNGGSFQNSWLPAGSYYVVIATWAPPQTVDYVMNLWWTLNPIPGTSGIVEACSGNKISVYPNPANGILNIHYSNDRESDLTIELVSVLGQVIDQKHARSIRDFQAQFDLTDMSNGIYYVRITTSKETETIKVLKK